MTQPDRFHKNVPGDFYTTGCEDDGDCLSCGTPEHEAPTLLAPHGGPDHNFDTYFIRQPSTPEETEAACRALECCCIRAVRYGGKDRDIIERLGNHPDFCDFVKADSGPLIPSRNADGSYRSEFREGIEQEHTATWNKFQATVDGQLVRWHLSWQEPVARLERPRSPSSPVPPSVEPRPSWIGRLFRSILGKTTPEHPERTTNMPDDER